MWVARVRGKVSLSRSPVLLLNVTRAGPGQALMTQRQMSREKAVVREKAAARRQDDVLGEVLSQNGKG